MESADETKIEVAPDTEALAVKGLEMSAQVAHLLMSSTQLFKDRHPTHCLHLPLSLIRMQP